jgi:hypothetical protein
MPRRQIGSNILTLALDGCEWSASRNGRFTHGMNLQYSLNRWVGDIQSRSGRSVEERSVLCLRVT